MTGGDINMLNYDDTSNIFGKYAIILVLTNTSKYANLCWQRIYAERRSYFFQNKKVTNPPIKKSKTPPEKKSTRPSPSKKEMAPPPSSSTTPTTSTAPAKTSTAPSKPPTSSSHPANFQPNKQPVQPKMSAPSKTSTNSSALLQPSKTLPAKSVTAKSVPEPVKTSFVPVKSSSDPTTPSAATSRPVRTLIPKWTPPAMNRSSNGALSSSQTPSPRIGLRVRFTGLISGVLGPLTLAKMLARDVILIALRKID